MTLPLQEKQMEIKDKRLKIIGEILRGIKVRKPSLQARSGFRPPQASEPNRQV